MDERSSEFLNKSEEKIEKFSQKNIPANEDINIDKTKKINNEQSFAEKVVNNAVSSFVGTETGAKFVQKFIDKEDFSMKSPSFSISTNNSGIARRKYQIQKVTSSAKPKTICGQKIVFEYTRHAIDGAKEASKEVSFKLGKGYTQDLNILADGMNLGEVISVYIEPSKIQDKPNKSEDGDNPEKYRYHIQVKDHDEPHNLDMSKIKIFDEIVSSARSVICGDEVDFAVKITDISGKIIQQKKIKFTLGDFEYPKALSYMLSYANFSGTRTVILPAEYLKSSNNPVLDHDDINDYVIAEISDISLVPKDARLNP
ncbi:MAG: hypothetical protein SFT91_02715 [Rickettsiaceae bacterium]|nr:hypothetical protein [Rickettsiaceae bacterium]